MSTVETSSALYAMDSMTHKLSPSLTAKVDLNASYQSIDPDAPMATTTSPRISSTPPSTPGLDSMQGKETMEEEDEHDDLPDSNNDDDDDDDDDNDDYDYGYNDYDDYLNEDYSEPDEDYFYKDFAEAGTTENGTATAPRRPKSKRYSRRHRSQKAMSRFDLQSFARQLHENRLSVLQTRQSRMILTEEDEQELDKLLARKYSHDNAPPVPSLPPLPSENTTISSSSAVASIATAIKPMLNTTETVADTKLMEMDNKDAATTLLVDGDGTSTELAGPTSRLSISTDLTKKNSIFLQKLNGQDLSIETSKDGSLDQVTVPVSPSLSDPSSLASPKQTVSVSPSESSSTISSNASTSKHDMEQAKAIPTLSLATSASTTVKKKPSWIASHLKQSTNKTKHQLNDTATTPAKAPRRSMSVDTLRDNARQKDAWKSTAAPKAGPISSPAPDVDQTRKPKLRLFGSLRQASRSSRASGEGAFRGLMRNLSTVGQRQQQQQQPQQQSSEQDATSPSDNSRNAASTMSQAAMAVIHHDASVKKEKLANKKEAATTTTPSPELSTKIEVDMMDGVDDTTEQVTHTATSTKGGVRLLTNLLAKARSARRPQKKPSAQQQDNNNNDNTGTPNERNKVIRRTIIYVRPDALDFMKDGHLPPIPAPKHRLPTNTNSNSSSSNSSSSNDSNDDVRFSNDTMMDDDALTTVEYATATKLTRQASRRKRLVENPITAPTNTTTSTTATATTASHLDKKWRLESVSQLDIDKPMAKENDDDEQLEGLELREMSDGTVVWGIVKKQGNRKSFFASNSPMDDHSKTYQLPEQQQREQQDDDDIEKSVLALMGLGPDSLDRFSQQQQQQQQRAGTGGVTPRKSKKTPPPIPKRSPRRLTGQHDNQGVKGDQQQQQYPGDAAPRRSERGLSVEEQLDEMMLTIKQAQF